MMNTLLFMLLTGFLVAFGGFVWQTSLGGITRKITARLQKRYGPKWYQEFLDIFKLLSKRATSHGWIFDFGVIMALGGIVATAMFMPVSENIIAFSMEIGGETVYFDNFFIFVYLLAVGMLGMAMSASGSGNPLASIGVMRALTTMVAYEVPFMVVALVIIDISGSSSLLAIGEYQAANGWFATALPLGFVVGFISLLGMLGKKPFETYIAPAEIASGPMVEYGGKQLGMLFILHELSIFIEVGLFVWLFLGGAENVVIFIVKYFAVYTLATLVSQVNGRFKIDQVVVFFYKWILPLAILQAIAALYLGWVI